MSHVRRRRYDTSSDDSDNGDSAMMDTVSGVVHSRNPSGRVENVNGLGDFNPGAIRRVSASNFVTYHQAEFRPGPNLNMIIGPNGTGKSSLVCAICLGLGFHPKHLGRAGTFAEFVKHGKESATIEIELQRRPHEGSHHVIRLVIYREDNSRKWAINGRDSTLGAVQSLVKDLQIQIDNLCQFLPQDKVAEFAGMTPVQLLRETLRAAAPRFMIDRLEELVKLHGKHKDLRRTADTDAESLRVLKNRQQALEGEVSRLRERDEIKKAIERLKGERVLVRYHVARKKFRSLKEEKIQAKEKKRTLQREVAPALRAAGAKEEYRNRTEATLRSRHAALRAAAQDANSLTGEISAARGKIEELDSKRNAERGSLEKKKRDLAQIRKEVGGLERKLENPPKEFAAAEWNMRIRELEHILRENQGEHRELDLKMKEIKDTGRAVERDIETVENDISALNSQEGQQLSLLRRRSQDAARGWEWLQNNRRRFKNEVFGPAMLSCKVKDVRYSNHVQALLGADDFLCFTAQTREDHVELSKAFYSEQNLSATIRTCTRTANSFRPPIPSHEAVQFGLDGFAIDFVDGPDTVLAMLCSEKRLHACGVSLSDTSDDQFNALLARDVTNWAAGSRTYRVNRRREYGPEHTSTVTRHIGDGRFWTDQPVDPAEKAELQMKLGAFSQRKNELLEELGELKEKGRALEISINESHKKLVCEKFFFLSLLPSV